MKNIWLFIVFIMIFGGCSRGVILSGIFWDIDKNGNGMIDIKEYHDTRKDWLEDESKVKGVSTIALAKKEFAILDTDKNNLLSKKELFDDEQNQKVYKDSKKKRMD